MSGRALAVVACVLLSALLTAPSSRPQARLRAWTDDEGPVPSGGRGAGMLEMLGPLLRLGRCASRRGLLGPPDPGEAAGGGRGRADSALVLDLVAAALGSGAPPSTAVEVTGEAVGGPAGAALVTVSARLKLGADDDVAWAGAPSWSVELQRTLALSTRTGASASRLLRDRADEVRRSRRRAAQIAAQRLGVRVVLPLGVCALPGFAAWGVAPVVLGLASDVLGAG